MPDMGPYGDARSCWADDTAPRQGGSHASGIHGVGGRRASQGHAERGNRLGARQAGAPARAPALRSRKHDGQVRHAARSRCRWSRISSWRRGQACRVGRRGAVSSCLVPRRCRAATGCPAPPYQAGADNTYRMSYGGCRPPAGIVYCSTPCVRLVSPETEWLAMRPPGLSVWLTTAALASVAACGSPAAGTFHPAGSIPAPDLSPSPAVRLAGPVPFPRKLTFRFDALPAGPRQAALVTTDRQWQYAYYDAIYTGKVHGSYASYIGNSSSRRTIMAGVALAVAGHRGYAGVV